MADRRTTHSRVCSFIHSFKRQPATHPRNIQVTQIWGDWLLLPQKDTPSSAEGAGCRGCAYKSASLDVSWGRQREVFPLPGSQDFPHSTINFHFGKSAHTHSHSHTYTHTHTYIHIHTHTHTHRSSSSCPAAAPREKEKPDGWLDVHCTCTKRAKRRKEIHRKRTGGALRSVFFFFFFFLIWCHLLEGDYRDKRRRDNDRKQPAHCRLTLFEVLFCFVYCASWHVHSSGTTWNGKTLSRTSSGL